MISNPFKDKKVLVVDDFGDMRMMLLNIMRMLGASDVDSAGNGQGAIEAMENASYDIVLCDYNLGPGKDGQQVLEEARHRGLIKMSTAFLMVTAESSRSMVMGALEYEPDAYISKPFSKDLIKIRLERVLARKKDLDDVIIAIEHKQFDKAIQLINRKLLKKPKNASDLMRIKAELCLQAGDYDCSTEVYERVLTMRELPWARLGLGKTLFAQKKYDEAIDLFRNLSNLHPDLTAAMDWLARCYQATGEVQRAKDILASALEISPRAILRQQSMGKLSLQTGDYPAAEHAFKQAVQLGRNSVYNHPTLYSNLARSQTSQDKHDEALKSVHQIKKTFWENEDADAFVAAGEAMVYFNQGDQEKSSQAMERASKLYETHGEHIDNELTLEMAKVASQLGDKQKAEKMLRDVVRNNHDDEDFLQSVTDTLREAGLSDNPEDFVAGLRKEVVEMNNRGVRLLQKGQLTEAVELFEQAASQMKGNLIINTNAARAMLMLMEKHGGGEEGLRKVRLYLERLQQLGADEDLIQGLALRLKKILEAASG